MGSIIFSKNQQIEMFITNYLNNLSFQNKNLRKKYFLPLLNHFDFFHDIILKILKKVKNKQEINLICNGLFILSCKIDFIIGNELENQLIEVVKDLDINKKCILKNLILFSGMTLSETNKYELAHNCSFKEFKNKFKQALKNLGLLNQLKVINSWSSFYFSWCYDFRISNFDKKLLQDPEKWFLSLIK